MFKFRARAENGEVLEGEVQALDSAQALIEVRWLDLTVRAEMYGLRSGLVSNSHAQRSLRPPIKLHGEGGCSEPLEVVRHRFEPPELPGMTALSLKKLLVQALADDQHESTIDPFGNEGAGLSAADELPQ